MHPVRCPPAPWPEDLRAVRRTAAGALRGAAGTAPGGRRVHRVRTGGDGRRPLRRVPRVLPGRRPMDAGGAKRQVNEESVRLVLAVPVAVASGRRPMRPVHCRRPAAHHPGLRESRAPAAPARHAPGAPAIPRGRPGASRAGTTGTAPTGWRAPRAGDAWRLRRPVTAPGTRPPMRPPSTRPSVRGGGAISLRDGAARAAASGIARTG